MRPLVRDGIIWSDDDGRRDLGLHTSTAVFVVAAVDRASAKFRNGDEREHQTAAFDERPQLVGFCLPRVSQMNASLSTTMKPSGPASAGLVEASA
jgi:hypothetical protein